MRVVVLDERLGFFELRRPIGYGGVLGGGRIARVGRGLVIGSRRLRVGSRRTTGLVRTGLVVASAEKQRDPDESDEENDRARQVATTAPGGTTNFFSGRLVRCPPKGPLGRRVGRIGGRCTSGAFFDRARGVCRIPGMSSSALGSELRPEVRAKPCWARKAAGHARRASGEGCGLRRSSTIACLDRYPSFAEGVRTGMPLVPVGAVVRTRSVRAERWRCPGLDMAIDLRARGIERSAEGPDVGREGGIVALREFGREVGGGSRDYAGTGQPGIPVRSRQAEVGDLHSVVAR